ncbi:MAG: hypothetical protein WAO61_04310 [Solirubrobacterales bacterium]
MSAAGNGGSSAHDFGDEFDDLIRDRDEDFGVDSDEARLGSDPGFARDSPGGGGRFRGSREGGFGGSHAGHFGDRGTLEAISRIIETLTGLAGDSLAPESRRQLEKILRDLLVAARDSLDWMIDRIDERSNQEVEIEEIPVD